jgi:hypothetical protein
MLCFRGVHGKRRFDKRAAGKRRSVLPKRIRFCSKID